MSGQNTSGFSNQQQALLITIAFVLASAGTFTSLEGVIKNSTVDEALGIAGIIAGVSSAAIKEYLGALGINTNVQPAQLSAAIEKYLADKGITFPPKS